MENIKISKVGIKRNGLKVNKNYNFSEVTQVSAGVSKSGAELEHGEFNMYITTNENLFCLKLTPKDAARIALFWNQYLPEHLKQ